MSKLIHCLIWVISVFLLWMPMANAHPLGNFTINHYAGLQIAKDRIAIDYVLDLAEIPAFQEINRLDIDRNRRAEPRETVNYKSEKCAEVNSFLHLQLNQQPLTLELNQSAVEFPPGVGGLSTLRLSCTFQARVALLAASNQLIFEDQFYARRLGWREITVVAGVPIRGEFNTSSVTKRLTDYPDELLSSPLNQRQVWVEINPVPGTITPAQPPVLPSNRWDNALTGRTNDVFTNLITKEKSDPLTILIALVVAFVWGGLHALSPGHGKTLVGAYLVGARSNAQQALFLGLTVTVTHTAGIFALGLITLGTSEFILTEQLFPWLSIFSGVMVTVIGLNLLIERLRNTSLSSSAVEPHHHHHAHAHSHPHEHSHLPQQNLKWSNLLALGVSGGLLPCPSALVVLLGAIAVGRVGFGLALVSAFSLGLAAVLTGIGLVLVYAKGLFERMSIQPPKFKLLPAVSALFITLIGLGITTQSLFVYVGR